MSTRNLPVLGNTTVQIVTADDAASAGTVGMRDASGDLYAVSHRSSGPVRGAQGIILGVSASKTSGFNADNTVRFYPCDTTSGSITVALPAAASNTGLILTFKKTVAANNLVLDGNAGETIDGALTKTSANQYASYTIISDGSNWHMISSSGTWT